ncbi:MAG: SDR family NAD(P)-dependent oxidoreductase [Pseudomonadota bacterium]
MNEARRQAVVTGGGSGIGLAIARHLAGAGCAVTLLGRDQVRLEAAAKSISGARAVPCDVADARQVAQTFSGIGPVDILVNNAGAVETAPFHKTPLEAWRRMLEVNVMGAVHCTNAALPGMRGQPFGRIINIASTAAVKGYAYASAYSASKHALLGLTRALALELASTSITVNAVCPGYCDTALLENAVASIAAKTGRDIAEARAQLAAANPQGRLISPGEVAQSVVWLASPEARSMTGQAIIIAGGEVM